MVQTFEQYLSKQNLASNSISSYLSTVRLYYSQTDKLNSQSVQDFKQHLLRHYKPATVNLRILGLNKYLTYKGKETLHLKTVRVQQKTFLENVISTADYQYLCSCLHRDGKMLWYFVVRFFACTGARVSELKHIKAEHIAIGYLDLYGKGNKMRRLYIPKSLRIETLEWLESIDKHTGFIFVNRQEIPLSTHGIASMLKMYSRKYGIPPKVVYPHSFRHRFAKNFLEAFSDLALLSDLMGHESIETTRIYLRRTSTEQQQIVDNIVTW